MYIDTHRLSDDSLPHGVIGRLPVSVYKFSSVGRPPAPCFLQACRSNLSVASVGFVEIAVDDQYNPDRQHQDKRKKLVGHTGIKDGVAYQRLALVAALAAGSR